MNDLLRQRAAEVDHFLEQCFTSGDIPPRLSEAMRYSLLAGGKRLRPVLCLSCALACGSDQSAADLAEAVMPFAAALEMIHTYSLIHDDLPAMDDDDLRRGRPSCHKAFDEATAILAGDALLTDAFGFMARAGLAPTLSSAHPSPIPAVIPAARVLEALRLAADAAGAAGMVGGQILDLGAEGRSLTAEELTELNAKKTGALLCAACECGAVLAGASPARRDAIRKYGAALGIAFQITDDILDVVGDQALLGKPVGSDAEHAKATWPALLGLDAARARAEEFCRAAVNALAPFSGPDADLLRHVALDMTTRTN